MFAWLIPLKLLWSKHGDKLIIGAIAIAVSLLIYGLVTSYGRAKFKAGADSVTVVLERERAEAAALSAAEMRRRLQMEREAQDEEDALRLAIKQMQAEFGVLLGKSDSARKRLLDHIAAYARSDSIGATASRPCGDLPVRVETLGVLVGERDAMAGECEAEIERIGVAFRICRGHAEIVDKFRQSVTDQPAKVLQ